MDSDSDDKDVAPTRYRSPRFTEDEVNILLNLVEKYKTIVFNKNTNAKANHVKEAIWLKIAETFNSYETNSVRHSDCLKTKLGSLRKIARKVSNNVMEMPSDELPDTILKVMNWNREFDNLNTEIVLPAELKCLTAIPKENECKPEKHKADDNIYVSSDDDDMVPKRSKVHRSMNFTPKECSYLIQCVRKEKKNIFSKCSSSKSLWLKNRAWMRVAHAFNKLSPYKRSTKVLRTKFNNMKKITKAVDSNDNSMEDKLLDGEHKRIKTEPPFDYESEVDGELASDDDVASTPPNDPPFVPDPLSTVLSGDSGMDSNPGDYSSNSNSKELEKMKIDLLKYKMENEKLKRKQIEESMCADAAHREARATETALRIRAARLEALAAEMKLPAGHPCLAYTPEEQKGKTYLEWFKT